jgi:dinuclear metal center YbgI/SA1388 family protein
MEKLSHIVKFLDGEFNPPGFTDASNNGLQVENSGEVRVVRAGVDASFEFFKKAAESSADLVICHHGISWGNSLNKVTGLNFKKIKFLIKNDIALYASHLPLDAHPEYGNNALICRGLGLTGIVPFGRGETPAGFRGAFEKEILLDEFILKTESFFGAITEALKSGKEKIKTAAVVSGSGSSEIEKAAEENIDVIITGEPSLSGYISAADNKINVIFAGHYKTEIFGVRKTAELVKEKFNVDSEFIDLKIKF